MKLKIGPDKIDWWYWTVTMAFISVALLGWEPGYYLVMIISGMQIVHFRVRQNSLLAFDTQVRIVYTLFTLLGLYDPIRFPVYLILLPGTFMVVFFDRCGIALVLKQMPWNKHELVSVVKTEK